MSVRLVAVLASLVLLAGCSKSADYYSKHVDEAQQKLSQCKVDQMDSGECKAAADGLKKALMNKAQDMMKEQKQ